MDKTSLLYWFPIIKTLDIPMPKTEIIPFENPADVIKVLDGDVSELNKIWDKVEEKGDELGYPLFMRTDLTSGKHSWKDTCFIETKKKLKENVYSLIDQHYCCDCGNAGAIVLREYIPMNTLFTAFWGEMPVNVEFRYFIRDGKILCSHWYWITEAIKGNTKEPDWKRLLRRGKRKSHNILNGYAGKVASVLPEFWSVDFCLAKDGRWILIDLAMGNQSWHPRNCHYAKQAGS